MQYGLIGEVLPHSFSKIIHEKIASYKYDLHELKPEEVDPFMRRADFRGINVSMPYQQTVIPYLDEVSDQAAGIGAVNTVVNRDGKLCGYNTDYFGMRDLLIRNGTDPAGRKVLILGTGAASKTAHAVVSDLGAAEIRKVSRTGKEGALTYEEACTSGESRQREACICWSFRLSAQQNCSQAGKLTQLLRSRSTRIFSIPGEISF